MNVVNSLLSFDNSRKNNLPPLFPPYSLTPILSSFSPHPYLAFIISPLLFSLSLSLSPTSHTLVLPSSLPPSLFSVRPFLSRKESPIIIKQSRVLLCSLFVQDVIVSCWSVSEEVVCASFLHSFPSSDFAFVSLLSFANFFLLSFIWFRSGWDGITLCPVLVYFYHLFFPIFQVFLFCFFIPYHMSFRSRSSSLPSYLISSLSSFTLSYLIATKLA